MCASFNQKDIDLFLVNGRNSFNLSSSHLKLDEQVYPFKPALVLVKDNSIKLEKFRYSLTPSWAKDEKVKWSTYNARLNRINSKTKMFEKIYEVPTWKSVFGFKNCIVPMVSFRESCSNGKESGKIVDFSNSEGNLLLVAGIYDQWVNKKTGEIIQSFAVVTTEPTEYISSIGHDRSPVFLSIEKSSQWLEGFVSPEAAYNFLNDSNLTHKLSYKTVRSLKGK